MGDAVDVDVEVASAGEVAYERHVVAVHGVPALPDAPDHAVEPLALVLLARVRVAPLRDQEGGALLVVGLAAEQRVLELVLGRRPEALGHVLDLAVAPDGARERAGHIGLVGVGAGLEDRDRLPDVALLVLVDVALPLALEAICPVVDDLAGVADPVALRVDRRAQRRAWPGLVALLHLVARVEP